MIKKLMRIQTELNAPKNQKNKFGGYNYRSCEDILEALKPLLKKEGCAVFLSDEVVVISDRFYVKATATITDGATQYSTSAYAREPLDKKGMDASQITGTASSYARKYALNGLFCIDDNKDADTDEYAAQTKAPAKAPAKSKPQPKANGPREATDAEKAEFSEACIKAGYKPGALMKEAGLIVGQKADIDILGKAWVLLKERTEG